MTEITPEEKIKAAIENSFHAAMINDKGIRTTFIDVMTSPSNDVTDAQIDCVLKFITAVDYMVDTLGYGICDMEAKGGPVHLSDID